jgi:hypothetical protein
MDKNKCVSSRSHDLLAAKVFRPFPSFLRLGVIESLSIHQPLPFNHLTRVFTTTFVTITQYSQQATP